MGNSHVVSRRRRSRRQSVEASAIQSQPPSRSAQPTNSTSTGARDPHAHGDVPVSQSARSATERSRESSQDSTATSNRLHPAPQPPIDRTNAATRPNSANLSEPQNAGSAAQPANSTERSIGREAACLSRRTVPPIDSAMAQSTHQAIPGRAVAQIGQPVTQRTQAAPPASLPRGMALRGEPMIRRADATVVRTALAGESSQTALPSMNVRRRPATGTEFPSVRTERAPAQATTARGMAPTGEPMNRRTNVTVAPHVDPRRDVALSEFRDVRAGSNPAIESNSGLRRALPHLGSLNRLSLINEYESRPSKIQFHVYFLAARDTSSEGRGYESIDDFVSRIIADRNAAVPDEHSRMKNGFIANSNEWALSRVRHGITMTGVEDLWAYPGKSVPFLFP